MPPATRPWRRGENCCRVSALERGLEKVPKQGPFARPNEPTLDRYGDLHHDTLDWPQSPKTKF